MHTTNQLLDALSARHGNATDYRLSKLLGTSPSGVTNWRKGRSSLSPDYAHKMAALLEWEPAYVLACVERESAQKDERIEQTQEIMATWEKIAERFRPALPGIVLACLGAFAGSNSEAGQGVAVNDSTGSDFTALYIMRTRKKRAGRPSRLWRWFSTIFPAVDPAGILAAP